MSNRRIRPFFNSGAIFPLRAVDENGAARGGGQDLQRPRDRLVVGVAVGVAVVTYISALIEGLQGNTIERTLVGKAKRVIDKRPR